VQPFGRAVEVLFLGDRDEVAQMTKLHSFDLHAARGSD
jgi:hypothetical protein